MRIALRKCLSLRGPLAALFLAIAGHGLAAEEEPIRVGDLLKGGWQIAGYTSTLDERSAFILFHHADQTYLVQCRAGYDVTRTPRVHTNCYKLE